MMTLASRIAWVTVGLIVAGSVFGALAGGLAFTTVGVLVDAQISRDAFGIGAFFGAPIGAVIAPLLSWIFLRRVPLGLMFVFCSIGTIVGGVVGWFIASRGFEQVSWALLGALLGCLAAATGLWMRTRHQGQRA